MTAPTKEPMDGGLDIDPAVAKVLLRLRETVADATHRAWVELQELGVDDPERCLLVGPRWQRVLGKSPRRKIRS